MNTRTLNPQNFGTKAQRPHFNGVSVANAAPVPGTWVSLLHPPTSFSYSEALLLCAEGKEQWRAWIPDFGEIVLAAGEFCLQA